MSSIFSGLERMAWIRFFIAIGGLALAFAAALFSTVARESGNLSVSVLLASSALLLAGVVGLSTVPYLARRVALRGLLDVFDYDVTREGLVYLAAVLLIAVAALNTGNNLLFIVVSAMLAAVAASAIASTVVLHGVELEASIPAHAFAGTKALARLTLRNLRRRMPAFSVSVVLDRRRRQKQWVWRRSEFGFPFSRPPERQWLRLPDLTFTRVDPIHQRARIFEGAAYFPYLPGRSAAIADVELCFPRRGRYEQDVVALSTRFPFSFLEKTRSVPLRRELIVYPRVEPTEEFFEILPMITGEFESFVRGRGHDLYRIREHMPDDSARHVDWKATARSMSLKVREYSREDERRLRIVFDNPAPGQVSREAYEQGIALAASLAWHFARENAELSFAGAAYGGSSDIHEFLHYLALLEPAEGESVLDRLQVSDDYNIIFTARPRGSVPTALWSCSYLLFLG